ncbi:hypothetical protein PAN31117_01866 [Pandoraea anapnoica]|uniref:Integrase catalytic domain-containing protein n=1 Tax=Pandoraea anapnoica TaxID=2508301 RepID=A0A5E4ZVJ1_9BURK|nr:transposase domain-containing protein [Pandoraea anapnoica]VVE65411.1 hypothetical protein PAN31117_01860 [Pandoraea anapnoica]VVE65428.1 hypothetical protein PAN31117_01866 [Pandoraea anapnoica]
MDAKDEKITRDLRPPRACTIDDNERQAHDPGEKPADIGETRAEVGTPTAIDHREVVQRSCKAPIAISAAQVAKHAGVNDATVRRRCMAGVYPGAFKAKGNGGEGWMVPIAALPASVQRKLAEEYAARLAARVGVKDERPNADELRGEYHTLWDSYERKPANFKRMAEQALEALLAYRELLDAGVSVALAKQIISDQHGVSGITVWRYATATEKHPRQHWLPLLCPRYRGGRGKAEFTPEAYQWILARYLNTSQTKIAVITKEAREYGASKGWVIPSDDTVAKRLKEEPGWLEIGGRKGDKALVRSFPAVERDYTTLQLHELWESDGRRADVWCVWPDGTIARPFIVIWRDVRTRLVLSARGCLHPHTAAILQSFGTAMERTGAAPRNAKLDNGREYASKEFSGGQPTRYRFQIKPGDPVGMMTRVGTVARWSKPAYGQDKPIESFWNYIAEYCDQAPEFQRAYCGKDAASKPDDFDRAKAIPLAEYQARLAAALEHFNHRPHSGNGMAGRSPYEVYTELLEGAQIIRPDAAHIRLCKMGMALVTLDKREASLKFRVEGFGPIRYWNEALSQLPLSARSKKYQVFYDLDDPTANVAVYDGETFICDASPIDRIPFIEEGGTKTRKHVEARAKYVKTSKAAIGAAKAAGESFRPMLTHSGSLSALPLPPDAVPIDARRTPQTPESDAPLWAQDAQEPGKWVNTKTGEVRQRNIAAPPVSPESNRSDAELEALRKEWREKGNRPLGVKVPKTA